MKILASIIAAVATILVSSAYGCDEECRKEQAQQANNITFSGYLSWQYCDDIRMDFMTTSMRSLENYQTKHFNPKYKGGMRNTKNFLEQRKAWLQECDTYLRLTEKGRIFDDEKTTKQIFAKMDAVTKELDDLLSGITYTSSFGQDASAVVGDKFQDLFKTVDDHKTLMHMKGRYVFR